MDIRYSRFEAMVNKVKYGIVMSGGGARGYAHIGVLKALLEKNIVPEVVAGTSAGSIAAVFYCDGKHPDEIFEILKHNDVNGRINFFNLVNGFLRHDNLKRVLNTYINAKTFDQLKYPLFVNATDYATNEENVFSEGSIADKIIASSAIPVIFEPCLIDGRYYVDGGIVNNLPAQPVRPLCDVLIGVHVNPITPWVPGSGLLDNLDRAMNMSIRHNIEAGLKLCDVVIEPPEVSKFQMFDSREIEAITKIGYEYASAFLSEINLDSVAKKKY